MQYAWDAALGVDVADLAGGISNIPRGFAINKFVFVVHEAFLVTFQHDARLTQVLGKHGAHEMVEMADSADNEAISQLHGGADYAMAVSRL
jgi:hypothetical protein